MPVLRPFAVLPLALTGIATGNQRANRPASHLALPQYPGMRWQSAGSGNLWVRGQFSGRIEAVNFMSLMAANAQPGTTIRLRLGTTQAQVDGTAPYDSGAVALISPARTRADGLYHSHLELPSTVNASWWRIDIAGHVSDFSASALIMGTKRTPSNFYNRDREIGYEDLGSLEIARNGVPAETPGAVLRTLLFRLQWVEDEEWWTQWAPLVQAKGKRQVVYWCFDPDSTVRRQDKSFLGYFGRDLFLRGNDFPKANQMDFQLRALDFGSVAVPLVVQLIGNSATLAVYDWTSPETMTAGGGGPVTTGSPIATVPNLKSPGTLDLGQSTAGRRPTYTNGATFDGTDDELIVPFSAGAGPANATLVYALRTADPQFDLGGATGSIAYSFWSALVESGSASTPYNAAGTPTYAVNGAAITTVTRNGLFAAWATNAPVIARVENVDFQDAGITGIRNSYAGNSYFLNGRACLIAILNAGDPNYAAALALAEQEAARVITALSI